MVTAGQRAGRTEWIALALMLMACLAVTMDLTILLLAAPRLSVDLEADSNQLLWITDAYGFCIAGGLILAGSAGDRFGHKRVLLAGIGLFGAASLAASAANGPMVLIVARGVQGLGGAMLLPSTMAMIFTMFPDRTQRARALGIMMAFFGLGAALGPIVGGCLLEWFSWRSVFIPNVPIAALVLIVGMKLMPRSAKLGTHRIDFVSACLSCAAILLAVYGMKQAARNGLAPLDLATLVVAFGLGAGFVVRQRRHAHPLVDLRLFRSPTFSAVLAANLLCFFVFYGISFFISQYLQLVLHLSPLSAGLWQLPGVACMMIASGLAPALADRIGPGRLIVGGMLVTATGLAALTALDLHAGLPLLIPAVMLMSVGVVPAGVLGINLIVGAAPVARAGMAAGVGQAVNELGGALGIALMGALGTSVFRSAVVDRSNLTSGEVPETLAEVVASNPAADLLAEAERSFLSGMHVVAVVGAVTLTLAAPMLLRALRSARMDLDPMEAIEAAHQLTQQEVAPAPERVAEQ
jgi:DHA2 family multidrug resistance protein-like MFS transporter